MVIHLNPIQAARHLCVPTSVYVHIPFCRRRCYYCDFPVSIVGDRLRGETSGTISQYVDVLCQEIGIAPAWGQSIETVFFGGGTPSLLSVGQLARILEAISKRFEIATDAEISMEMDPGTFDLEQLQGYRTAGVNRVSLGVQSFQPAMLQVSGRSHNSGDIHTAIELVHRVVSNFSLDLISGLPYQTLEQWQADLETAVAINPNHISIYDLTIEPVTAFGQQYQPGVQPLPTDETTVEMYQLAQQVLTSAGYEHYEISNYAQAGYQCRHNRVYWENRPYYGFGMGAASYVDGQRFTRPRKTREYYSWVQELIGSRGVIDCPQTPVGEVLLETLMLGMRLADGVSLSLLVQQFGEEMLEPIWGCLRPYVRKGWVEVVGAAVPGEGRLRLTDPEGFLFSNVVLAELFGRLG